MIAERIFLEDYRGRITAYRVIDMQATWRAERPQWGRGRDIAGREYALEPEYIEHEFVIRAVEEQDWQGPVPRGAAGTYATERSQPSTPWEGERPWLDW